MFDPAQCRLFGKALPIHVRSNASWNRIISFTGYTHTSTQIFRLMDVAPLPVEHSVKTSFMEHSATRPEQVLQGPSLTLPDPSNLYVAVGLEEPDPGFQSVARAVEALGVCTPIDPSLWHVQTKYMLEEVFRQLNTSMMDRRIDSDSGLLVLDPNTGQAKWHLKQPLSDLIQAHWAYENNLFISFSLKHREQNHRDLIDLITRLGIWAPISKSTWYVSSEHTVKDAFPWLTAPLMPGDQLCLFDNTGSLAIWQEGASPPSDRP